MASKTDIGQILLTHPRDENFTTLFEEAFQKQGESVELFAVIEIEDQKHGRDLALLRADCEKLAGGLVGALKKAYITAPIVDQNTFEKALTAVNAALARALRSGRAGWFHGLNVVLGALHQTELSLAACGNAKGLLWRGGEITALSEGLAEAGAAVRPTKIFSNYSSGALRGGDRVIFSTKQLFNYLSLERLREHLAEDTVAEICQEIITDLAENKTIGFATFVFEFGSPGRGRGVAAGALPAYKPAAPGRAGGVAAAAKVSLTILAAAGSFLWAAVKKLGAAAGYLFTALLGRSRSGRSRSGKSKKWILTIVGVLILILLGNLAFGAIRKSLRRNQASQTNGLQQIEKIIQEGEAALIYRDEKSAAADVNEAEKLLSANANAGDQGKRQELAARLADLKNKLNKTVRIDNPTVLATFAHVPTDMLRSPNGILAMNHDSVSLAYYDFRTGAAKSLLAGQNISRLVAGAFVGGDAGYLFLDRDGVFARLDIGEDKLVPYATAGPKGISRLAVLGTGNTARLYALDRPGSQIWRIKMTATDVSAPEAWFKTTADLNGASDMTVDGAIYLLRAETVEKYFNGARQDFTLSPAIPPVLEPTAIFANDAAKSLYLLDPKQNRILVYDKTSGKLQNQFISAKFRDAADLYADETAKLIYVIAGNELLQIKIPSL